MPTGMTQQHILCLFFENITRLSLSLLFAKSREKKHFSLSAFARMGIAIFFKVGVMQQQRMEWMGACILARNSDYSTMAGLPKLSGGRDKGGQRIERGYHICGDERFVCEAKGDASP